MDEIHKYIHWRRIVKGFYDEYGRTKKLLVTGSARLDHYGKGGDSLFGRTRYYRMHPFSLSELSKTPREIDFVILKKGKPIFAVECKTGDQSLSPHIRYFKERINIPEFWQVHQGKADFGDQNTNGRVLPFWKFIREKNFV